MHPASPTRVLLVEDEPTIVVTLGDDLADQGHDVVHADCGRRAIELLGDRRFDAVITDLRLPGTSGLEVVRAARAADPAARVMVISAVLQGLEPELLAAGAEATLSKPFDNRSVLAWLAEPGAPTDRSTQPRNLRRPAGGDSVLRPTPPSRRVHIWDRGS